jgi:hypothetical protein
MCDPKKQEISRIEKRLGSDIISVEQGGSLEIFFQHEFLLLKFNVIGFYNKH